VAIERNIASEIPSECSSRSPDADIAQLARAQHGVVCRRQLVALGLGGRAIDHRIAIQRLHPIHRGVYAVGHAVLSRHGAWLAAVLAAGPDAVLSHRSAAALWGIRSGTPPRSDVIAPRRLRRPDVRAHRVVLAADEVTTHHGIPVTTPARTLFDLAAVVGAQHLEHAFNEAEVHRLTSPTSVAALLARYPARRGTTSIARVLAKQAAHGETPTRSALERRFLGFVDTHGLPRPKINRFTDHGELDATWPEQRLVVELDGFAAHGTRKAFEDDRARDRELTAAGWRVVRITWRQLTADADTIARQLSALLGGPPASPRTRPPRSARRARRPPPATPATRSAGP
jgi:very-short-patch-repair endonuclease